MINPDFVKRRSLLNIWRSIDKLFLTNVRIDPNDPSKDIILSEQKILKSIIFEKSEGIKGEFMEIGMLFMT